MNPKVFIIILQYNNSQDTIRCLGSVKELEYPNFEVVVIDNNSNPDEQNNTRFFVESQRHDSKVHFLANGENLGYASGNNKGIEFALAKDADYILILNPDLEVEKNLLAKLVKRAGAENRIGIVGPAIDEGGKIVHGGELKWLRPELKHLSPQAKGHFFVSGAAMLIKKDVIEKVGPLDERYFLYFEDVDYCVRACKAGYSLAIVTDALVHHRVSSATSKLGPAILLYYHYRNAHLFNWKNAPLPVKIVLPFWSLFVIVKQILKVVFAPSKRKVSYYILRGVIDFYKGKFGIK